MRIIFMGTPEFACLPLRALHKSKHDIAAVVTGVDKPSGRGRKLLPTPVASLADSLGLPVIKAPRLKSKKLFAQLEELAADLFVVIAFRILPQSLIDLPKTGAINVHGSLLPKYRGAAPINWALINGEKETGLTSFFLKKTIDTGNMIYQEKLSILERENFDSLHDRMSEMAGPFLLKTLEKIEQGDKALSQDDNAATPAPKISPFDALIDFGMPAEAIVNFVRGLSSRPGAYTWFRGKKLKILTVKPCERPEPNSVNTRPGTILKARKELIICCNGGGVVIETVVPEGKKPMDGRSFINGVRPEIGELFGEIAQGVKE